MPFGALNTISLHRIQYNTISPFFNFYFLLYVYVSTYISLIWAELPEVNVMDGWMEYTFLSRVSILTRDIDIANLSVRPSARLSVTFRYQMKTA